MNINTVLQQQGITKYRLAKISGVAQTTVIDICSGKTNMAKCSAETVYKLAKALGVTMESLLAASCEYRPQFETFKSNICHAVKDLGDLEFIKSMLESGRIRVLFEREWYPECLYLLAMVDYLSRENDLPLCSEYEELRRMKLQRTLFPAGILTLCATLNGDEPKLRSLREAIPEFLRHNIVEAEVRNVY